MVKAGGLWLRLGPWDRSANDTEARKTVAARGAKANYGDLGRYWFQPEYKAKAALDTKLLADAARLYAEGKVKPTHRRGGGVRGQGAAGGH